MTYILLKTEAAGESEISTRIFQTSILHVPEQHNLNIGMLSARIAQSL
jgi:UDP-N-acetylglucosamine enolpyruvyl transferase